MNPTFVSYLLAPAELPGLPSFKDDDHLLNFLIESRYLVVVDWKGEEEPFQIGNFIRARLNVFHPGTTPDIEKVYQSMQEQVDSMETGDSVPFLLTAFQALLKKDGFTIVLSDQGNDSYYIGMISSQHLKNLKKQATDFWHWKAFGDLSGEVLYTVNCSCGSMNVWQVKRGTIITEDTCQDCGKEIFDKAGNSPFEVIREYI